RHALDAGATGVQVGTAFAYCDESGMRDDYKRAVLALVAQGAVQVVTDPLASPSGFPFKVAQVDGTVSDAAVYGARPRICDLGYLREPYRTAEGAIGYRCPAEPVSVYTSKGGHEADAQGRKCICNALMATAGLPQTRSHGRFVEAGIVTAGDDLIGIGRFLAEGATHYTAADVVRIIMAGAEGVRA
ncbi:MAG: hypothetical protein Q7V01_14270, partial [Vicinamibacterales bacterium]|nr:hypothetical protein [Vicinamibacterales bacterium]